MNIEAHLNNLRISPRKVLVVAKMLKGLSVREAGIQLDRELRRAALPLGKLLSSAVANAEHNFQAVPENLVVSKITVGEGRKLKRWMPRAQGRATPIWKRMSQVHIVLTEKDPKLRASAPTKKLVHAKKDDAGKSQEKVSKTVSFSDKRRSGGIKKSSGARSSNSIFHRKSV
ncbi:MAG: 50S ribosomal protein L22 [Candidatus Moraniibacteriota bacterium]|nr:MAG: 50S ribosomal protein L22 [Candidatus Moranbacteria bacterium]